MVYRVLILVAWFFITSPYFAWASSATSKQDNHELPQSTLKSFLERIQSQWGGHLKVIGTASWPGEESFFHLVDTGSYYDGDVDFRLKNKLYFSSGSYLDTHYELIFSFGDTIRNLSLLETQYPDFINWELIPGLKFNDNRRLMDLTGVIAEGNDYILYHRLDRLSLTLQPDWGLLRIGRQAITWGNGFIFNPMDLLNPFSPTDVNRDYKVGEDMVVAQWPLESYGDFQILYVPRRNPLNSELEWDYSSLAGKFHFSRGITEYDIMAAKHYEDFVIGSGSAGYIEDAAWRLDTTWTFLHSDPEREGFLSIEANLDYAWIWWGNNMYGFIEFFFNGLGTDDYSEALMNKAVIERIIRGELFTLGRYYLSGEVQVEIHPLVKLYLSSINNIADPSGIIQPRISWDALQNMQLIIGGNIYWGGSYTEFGGYRIPATNLLFESPDSVYAWITYFF
ncbi:hypothetical protein ACFL9U_10880 [Thermodesulfobacteriota bacterium]